MSVYDAREYTLKVIAQPWVEDVDEEMLFKQVTDARYIGLG